MRFIANFALTFAVAGVFRWLDNPLWLSLLLGVAAGVILPLAFEKWLRERNKR